MIVDSEEEACSFVEGLSVFGTNLFACKTQSVFANSWTLRRSAARVYHGSRCRDWYWACIAIGAGNVISIEKVVANDETDFGGEIAERGFVWVGGT